MPSAAEATAFACASPQRPEAIAIEKPALIGTQCPLAVGLPDVPAVWANARALNTSSSVIRKNNFLVILLSFVEIAPRRWFPSSSYSRAHTEGTALSRY